ncbi:glutamyl-tRNA(Gln) amidotransferase, A subunit [Desulfofarcimen acetoxidans DSM 771]|uniref:Glutamyl-tRNA(Gln) amidotransferase subunit A n=1 Tax=Desulfofarcimen acetoxidans (strain ATCC 49208 / DSM 771 / KCTC 5769 / VKM B-1644 / 5575) TaxID=485916 RepID=C8W211_DESAS|nr:Asp-tRNA(Asn)/Glu-tRNA(Gln) amidotransferase subunit GatA [Desulfofarcimen acetoxidans]ACV61675.1 glutamyl-tRNA(Gln) amidotransferase, A subunit [Desulfofarcimen acetoxidans DSM 771]
MQLYQMTAHELHRLLVKKEVSAVEIAKSVYDRTDDLERKINAYITLTKEKAMRQAEAVDAKIAAGEAIAPLSGIPVAVKDNICTKDVRTTCASKILHNFVPPYNATVMEKLEANQAVLLGKTNMDEFAMGSSTENSAYFVTKNPWNIERVTGGSSGGSAAVIAAGEAVCSLGSDTGGSIRQPAALCGVVGMKPTYGAVSRYGLVAFASSLDQIGPFTRDVADCAIMLNAICGYDPKDSTSAKVGVPDYTSFLINDVKGLKIGVPKEYMAEGIEPEVRKAIEAAIEKFIELGAEVEETVLPHTDYALPTYYIIAPAEASSNLARYDGVRYGHRTEEPENIVDMFMRTRSEGFGEEVKRRIMLGTYALSAGYYDAYYLKALKVRTLIMQDLERAFAKYDVLLSPTTPSVAFKMGEKIDSPIQMYLSDICTLSANLAGIPAMSLPAGFVGNLPVGMQLMGKPFDEGMLLRFAYTFEQNTDFHKRLPLL